MKKDFEEIKRLVNEAGLESPSSDFLQSVMDQIEEQSIVSKSIGYEPLITKRAWAVIAFVVVTIVVSLFFDSSSDNWISFISLTDFSINAAISSGSSFQLYNTSMYGLVFLGALFAVQVLFLNEKIKKDYLV